MAGQRARVGERDGTRGGACDHADDYAGPAACVAHGKHLLGEPARSSPGCESLRPDGGDRAAHYRGQAGAMPLEPDRGGGVLQNSAVDAEPEDQAAECGDQEARARLETFPLPVHPPTPRTWVLKYPGQKT